MATSKVTEKFQIVIPREICNKLHLNKGDTVEFQVRKGKIILAMAVEDKLKKTVQDAVNDSVSVSVQYQVDEAVLMPVEEIVGRIVGAVQDRLDSDSPVSRSMVSEKLEILIPREIRDKVPLNKGDIVELQVRKGKIILRVVNVPKSEAWYWTDQWQKKVKGSAKDLEKGKARTYKSVAQLRKDLGN